MAEDLMEEEMMDEEMMSEEMDIDENGEMDEEITEEVIEEDLPEEEMGSIFNTDSVQIPELEGTQIGDQVTFVITNVSDSGDYELKYAQLPIEQEMPVDAEGMESEGGQAVLDQLA